MTGFSVFTLGFTQILNIYSFLNGLCGSFLGWNFQPEPNPTNFRSTNYLNGSKFFPKPVYFESGCRVGLAFATLNYLSLKQLAQAKEYSEAMD